MDNRYKFISIILLLYFFLSFYTLPAQVIDQKQDNKFQISGYFQAQTEIGQLYANTYTGKTTLYDPKSDKNDFFIRYGIRRGRVKLTYKELFAKAVFQMDLTENGVALKDAYIQLDDTFFKIFALKIGVFDRPFGYEISYSSAKRETPERSMIFQKLFPDERDLGASLNISAPEGSFLTGLKLEAGLFSGNGIRKDDNSKLDFIGHLKYDKKKSGISYGIGISLYKGTTNNADSILNKIQNSAWTTYTGIPNTLNNREYIGFDGQVSITTLIGVTQIRAEYLFGQQPSLSNNFLSPKSNSYDTTNTFNYIRNFIGGYIYFIQDIDLIPVQLVYKYSYLDPNTKLKGNEIYNITDLYLHAHTLGGIWHINPNLCILFCYEIFKNETSQNIQDYQNDRKDNLCTVRLQYKF